jgi:hypothetical protein
MQSNFNKKILEREKSYIQNIPFFLLDPLKRTHIYYETQC